MTPEQRPVPGPLARRIAAAQPKPEPDRRPAWLRNLQPKDMTGRVLS